MMCLRHAGIVVSDMDRALRFYRDLLGLRLVKTLTEHGQYINTVLGMPGVRVRTVKLADEGGSMLELLEFNSPESQERSGRLCDVGPSHVAFTVKDIDRTYARLSGEGVAFISTPCCSPDGGARVAFCCDPDGTPVELVEVVSALQEPAASPAATESR